MSLKWKPSSDFRMSSIPTRRSDPSRILKSHIWKERENVDYPSQVWLKFDSTQLVSPLALGPWDLFYHAQGDTMHLSEAFKGTNTHL